MNAGRAIPSLRGCEWRLQHTEDASSRDTTRFRSWECSLRQRHRMEVIPNFNNWPVRFIALYCGVVQAKKIMVSLPWDAFPLSAAMENVCAIEKATSASTFEVFCSILFAQS